MLRGVGGGEGLALRVLHGAGGGDRLGALAGERFAKDRLELEATFFIYFSAPARGRGRQRLHGGGGGRQRLRGGGGGRQRLVHVLRLDVVRVAHAHARLAPCTAGGVSALPRGARPRPCPPAWRPARRGASAPGRVAHARAHALNASEPGHGVALLCMPHPTYRLIG